MKKFDYWQKQPKTSPNGQFHWKQNKMSSTLPGLVSTVIYFVLLSVCYCFIFSK